tara:strand:- start:1864 stop:2427 length:564 start_codon:yes stop_codon:yes gene_type:complete
MKLQELNKMLNDFGKYMVQQSKSNLTRQKKGGGPLYNSITYDVKETDGKLLFEFEMQEYGEFQDKGVRGANPSNVSPNARLKGQQAPNSPYRFGSGTQAGTMNSFIDKVAAWAQIKNIRFRDKKGRYSKGDYRSLGYVIASNIYNRGLKPSLFYTKPFDKAFERLPDELFESFAVDVEHGITEQINK